MHHPTTLELTGVVSPWVASNPSQVPTVGGTSAAHRAEFSLRVDGSEVTDVPQQVCPAPLIRCSMGPWLSGRKDRRKGGANRSRIREMSIYINDAEFLPTGCIEQTLDHRPPGTDCCSRYPARAIAGPAFTTFLNPAVHDPRPSCCWVNALASAPPSPNCPLIVVDLLGPRAHLMSLLAGGYDDYNGRTLIT